MVVGIKNGDKGEFTKRKDCYFLMSQKNGHGEMN